MSSLENGTTKEEDNWVSQRSSLSKASCGRMFCKLVEGNIAESGTMWDFCVLRLFVGRRTKTWIFLGFGCWLLVEGL